MLQVLERFAEDAMLLLVGLALALMGFGVSSRIVLVVAVIIGGAFLGVNNTLITTAVMQPSPVERPVASASYSSIRFVGGAAAPLLAGKLVESFSPGIPFYVGAVTVIASIADLFSGHSYLTGV